MTDDQIILEALKIDESPLCKKAAELITKLNEHLDEAEQLIQCAHHAHQKMRLEGCGADGLPHEIRMFACDYSLPEKPRTPQHVILKGNGRYWKWWLRGRPGAYEELRDKAWGGEL